MVNELSLNQTVQGEVGEFNTLEAGDVTLDTLSVSGDVTFDSDVTIEGELTVNDDVTIDGSLTIDQWLKVDRFIEVRQNVEARDFLAGNWKDNNNDGELEFEQLYSLREVGALAKEAHTRTHIITDKNTTGAAADQVLAKNLYIGEWTVENSEDARDYRVTYNVKLMLEDLEARLDAGGLFQASTESRLKALEDSSPTISIPDDLSTTVQALQTRIGTLESLIGLLTNNNTNDTAIEHRISRLEKTILALKAIHDAKKSVYNIPLDW